MRLSRANGRVREHRPCRIDGENLPRISRRTWEMGPMASSQSLLGELSIATCSRVAKPNSQTIRWAKTSGSFLIRRLFSPNERNPWRRILGHTPLHVHSPSQVTRKSSQPGGSIKEDPVGDWPPTLHPIYFTSSQTSVTCFAWKTTLQNDLDQKTKLQTDLDHKNIAK